MKPKVMPILNPVINWQEFIRILQDAGIYSTRRLDDFKIEIGDFKSYLLTLFYIKNPNGPPPAEALKHLGQVSEHLFFSFLVHADSAVISEIYRRATLRTISLETTQHSELIVASGTLTQWHAAILEFCSPTVSIGGRLLFDALLIWFERAGLRVLWSNYRKLQQEDSTFILEQRE